MSKLSKEQVEMLREPFPLEDIQWKPQTVDYKSKTALAIAYADARAYVDRLNTVFGVGNWSDSYQFIATPFNKLIKGKKAYRDNPATEDKEIPGNKVLCVAKIEVPEYSICVSSTGDSDAADENAATSAEAQAFKRAAMKLGLGRYLYELPKQTCGYDYNKWTTDPKLPDWALPSFKCEECANKIVTLVINNASFSIAQVIKNSQSKYGKNLCGECQKKLVDTAKKDLGRPIV